MASPQDSLKRAIRSPGHAPEGYRQFISPRRRYAVPLLHLSHDGERTLCRLYIHWMEGWQEPKVTQRTKCKTCWSIRAEAMREPAKTKPDWPVDHERGE